MKDWQKISLMLCIFGFLKQLRPSDPFIVDFYLGPWRNLTANEVFKIFFNFFFKNILLDGDFVKIID